MINSKIFETKDKTGREIYLTRERWHHIAEEHPEMIAYTYELPQFLLDPTKIMRYEYDPQITYYYEYIKQAQKYILIIVKYLNGKGFIITAYFVRNIK